MRELAIHKVSDAYGLLYGLQSAGYGCPIVDTGVEAYPMDVMTPCRTLLEATTSYHSVPE